ncbi:MAG TPA: DUF2141 domain-containing protein [Deltaproteobacteria bacterium]|nr:DUF2141 domain-containing protein [Deltaproteobacteria bacterium]HOI06667.1 DUF2141 domain-containing protein [Deltaproteobacteria bacterium]
MRFLRAAFLLVSALIFSCPLSAGDAPPSGDLTMIITGFKSDKGMARISVMDSEQALTNEAKSLCLIRSRIIGRKVEFTLRGLPYGQYAIVVFHDVNSNGVLDKNLMGVPKEAYGSSNNVRGKFGPPDYGRIRFDLAEPGVTQEIVVR